MQRLLLAVAILVLALTVTVFIGYRRMTSNPDVLLAQIQKKADMQLNKIRQTATKNGVREWRMEAESATLMEKQDTVLLTRPNVEFYMNDGDDVHLTADKGRIYPSSNRMDVSGKVLANTSLYRFSTEALRYNPAKRELCANTPVNVSGQFFTLRAGRMVMDLETRIMRFEGGVEGTISENFQL